MAYIVHPRTCLANIESIKRSGARGKTGLVSLPAAAMDTINRSAIVIRSAQPFLDWLHRVDPTSVHLTLEDLQREPTIYLVAECHSQDEVMKYLGESVSEIFEEQLEGLYRVPEVWPAKCDSTTFQSWFEVSVHSMIVDLCDDLLEHEAL